VTPDVVIACEVFCSASIDEYRDFSMYHGGTLFTLPRMTTKTPFIEHGLRPYRPWEGFAMQLVDGWGGDGEDGALAVHHSEGTNVFCGRVVARGLHW
jgi:hypothetical protein